MVVSACTQMNMVVDNQVDRPVEGISWSNVLRQIRARSDGHCLSGKWLADARTERKYLEECSEQYEYGMASQIHDMEQRLLQRKSEVPYGIAGKVPNDSALKGECGRYMIDNEGLRWTQDELLGMLKKKEAEVTALRIAFAKIEVNAGSVLESFLERKRSEEVRDWSLSSSVDGKKEENVGEDIASQLTSLIQSSIRNDLLDQVAELSTKVDLHLFQVCEYLHLCCETAESGLRKLLSAGVLSSIDPSFTSEVFELPLGRTFEELPKSCLIGMLQSLRTVGMELAHRNALLQVQNTMSFPVSDSLLRATVITLGELYKDAREELMDTTYQHSFSDQCGEGLTDSMMARYKEQMYSLRILLSNIIVAHSPVRVMKEMSRVKKE
ncbi:hypothetical protein CBR_g46188 [Chara braunii]|uniref:Uncharacterized protein n=1 Tax=Chara braunii TaxID=69332 RepID=A0A388LZZ4_CHABU|nr:hypothetical protein CBR_g46188 [Chara braunii]|eukprot:GBG87888.1 hypothetical protein CBR_g46188 [Chara braunii]